MAVTGFLVATRSERKLAEIRRELERTGEFEVMGLEEAGVAPSRRDDEVEVFDSFQENALAKACHYFVLGGFRPTLADDSGLVVDALGGEPGVRSRRYASSGALDRPAQDLANNRLLVERMAEVPEDERTARYVCALVLVGMGSVPLLARGTVEGRILRRPRGGGGFGYDPYFLYPPKGLSFAELEPEGKDAVSHRGRAIREMAEALRATAGG